MSFIYLIVGADGQATEQGFKVWVDEGNLVRVCSSIRSSCVLKVGELFGVLLAGWPYIWVWMIQEWRQNISGNYLRGKTGGNNLGTLLC